MTEGELVRDVWCEEPCEHEGECRVVVDPPFAYVAIRCRHCGEESYCDLSALNPRPQISALAMLEAVAHLPMWCLEALCNRVVEPYCDAAG